jgi:hypothetical protein
MLTQSYHIASYRANSPDLSEIRNWRALLQTGVGPNRRRD